MIERCAVRQWAGLPDGYKEQICGRIGVANGSMYGAVPQRVLPIWEAYLTTERYEYKVASLISIKEDVL